MTAEARLIRRICAEPRTDAHDQPVRGRADVAFGLKCINHGSVPLFTRVRRSLREFHTLSGKAHRCFPRGRGQTV